MSRVGGAAQTRAMQKVSGTLRIDLAQYKEIESFAQFSSDLDEDTRNQIIYGEQLMEILKQPLYHPMSMVRQVVVLCVATSHRLINIPKDQVKAFVDSFCEWMEEEYADLLKHISDTGAIQDDEKEKILEALEE